jgi:hypothetical protein
MKTMIPLGAELKAWALTVSGYGTVLEVDYHQAQKEAKHFEGRGRTVLMTEMVAVTAVAPKPTLLLWNELTVGEYWAFPLNPYPGQAECELVSVTEYRGTLSIDGDNQNEYLNESWARFQYLPHVQPRADDVVFQSVEPSIKVQGKSASKIDSVLVDHQVLMSHVVTVTNEQKEWLARTKSVVASRTQSMINSLLYRIENQAGEALTEWRAFEAQAISEAMASARHSPQPDRADD